MIEQSPIYYVEGHPHIPATWPITEVIHIPLKFHANFCGADLPSGKEHCRQHGLGCLGSMVILKEGFSPGRRNQPTAKIRAESPIANRI
jgi:hypothetical protein